MSKIMSNRIQMYRKSSGIKQIDLANIIGVSRTYLSKLENTKYNPSVGLIFKLCETFDCDIKTLFTIQDEFDVPRSIK